MFALFFLDTGLPFKSAPRLYFMVPAYFKISNVWSLIIFHSWRGFFMQMSLCTSLFMYKNHVPAISMVNVSIIVWIACLLTTGKVWIMVALVSLSSLNLAHQDLFCFLVKEDLLFFIIYIWLCCDLWLNSMAGNGLMALQCNGLLTLCD